MELTTAALRAHIFMEAQGLTEKGWTFAFDRATSRLGQTNFAKKRITISKHFTGAATPEEFMQTLFHEVAHALLPVGVKHGRLWKMKAKELGYTGGRTALNPYHKQLATQRRMANPHPSLATDVVAGVAVAAEEADPTLEIGDVLALPNGVKLTVQLIGNRKVLAEDADGVVWKMATQDAADYRQH